MGKNNQIRTVKRELRRAKADLASLSAYLGECEEILIEYERDWAKVLSAFVHKKDSSNDSSGVVDSNRFSASGLSDEENEAIKNVPEWLKKIFRKIAQKTHPDKTSDDVLNEMYQEALECIEKEDIQEIFNMCDILNIDYDIDPEYELKINREKQENIKGRLSEIDKSPAWIWGESYSSLAFRTNFLMSLLPHYGVKITKEEIEKTVIDLSENE